MAAEGNENTLPCGLVFYTSKAKVVPLLSRIAEQQPAVIRVNVTSGIRPILSNDNCPSEFKDLITRCWDLRPDARLSFRGEHLMYWIQIIRIVSAS